MILLSQNLITGECNIYFRVPENLDGRRGKIKVIIRNVMSTLLHSVYITSRLHFLTLTSRLHEVNMYIHVYYIAITTAIQFI